MNVILELPAEIIGAVVGSWLEFHEIMKLDNAFYHAQQRALFLDSILQSPRCLVADVPGRFGFLTPAICLEWFALKQVRMEVVQFSQHSEQTIWESYLQTFGQCVKFARFEHMFNAPNNLPNLVAKYCVNLTSLVWKDSESAEKLMDLVHSCTKLTEIVVVDFSTTNPDFIVEDVPCTHHLHLKSIDMTCDAHIEKMIFRVSAPASVQKLRVNNINAPDWSQFVNLRSLGFQCDVFAEDEPQLLCILRHCPLIVNLDVSNLDLLTDEVVGRISRSLRQLRSLNIQYSSDVTDRALREITSHHKQTLEALFTKTCNNLTVAGINHVLKECPRLHTISYNSFSGVHYSLMGNITTLLLGNPVDASGWVEMCLHCRNLQYLHVTFGYELDYSVVGDVVNTVCGLPKLRTLYVKDLPSKQYKQIVAEVGVRRRTVRVTDTEDESEWYKLFDMPI